MPKDTKTLSGSDYIAKVRLSDKENNTLAEEGETCEKVPAESLPWLAKQKLIVEGNVDELTDARKAKGKKKAAGDGR